MLDLILDLAHCFTWGEYPKGKNHIFGAKKQSKKGSQVFVKWRLKVLFRTAHVHDEF